MSEKNFVSYADEEVLMAEIGEKIKSGDTYKMFLGIYNPITDEFVDPNTGDNIEKILGAPYHDMITGQYFMGVPYSGGEISFYPVRNSLYSASSTSMSQMTEYYGNFAIVNVKWYNTDDNLTYEPVFTVVDSPSGNPKTQGWYEGATTPFSQTYYTPTSDTSVQSGKTYYSFEWKEVIADLDPKEITVDYSNIISIADAFPKAAKDVRLKVEAVQDLHGYNNPWVGGAGKNILPNECISRTISSVEFNVNDDGTVKVNGTASSRLWYTVNNGLRGLSGKYILSGCPVGGTPSSSYVLNCYDRGVNDDADYQVYPDVGNGVEITFDPTHLYRFLFYITTNTTVNGTIKPMLRLATETDASYAPYSNICPISGWDNAKVTRNGKNLLPCTATDFSTSGINCTVNEDNTVHIVTDGTSTTGKYYEYLSVTSASNYPLKEGKTYIINGTQGGSGSTYYLHIEMNGETVVNETGSEVTFVAPPFNTSFKVYIRIVKEKVFDVIVKPMIRLASITDDTYEPYKGVETTISLNGTRYGGTLDVTSGVLTLTHGYASFNGSENWTFTNEGNYDRLRLTGTPLSGLKPPASNNDVVHAISNQYIAINSNQTYAHTKEGFATTTDGAYLYLYDSTVIGILTIEEWKARLASNPLQIVYELATPVTVQLTAEEVQLLQGYNTLFGDTGDISLTYNPATFGNIVEEVGELEDDVTTQSSQIQALTDEVQGHWVTGGVNLWFLQSDFTSTLSDEWVLSDTAFSLPAGTYTVSIDDATSEQSTYVNLKNGSTVLVSNNLVSNGGRKSVTFTISQDATTVAINMRGTARTISNIQIEKGSTATPYQPYVKTNLELTVESTREDVTVTPAENVTLNSNTHVYKRNGVVDGSLRLSISEGTTGQTICTLSEHPKNNQYAMAIATNDRSISLIIIGSDGKVTLFGTYVPSSEIIIPVDFIV